MSQDYMRPYTGNGGEFGITDAPRHRGAPKTKRPWVRVQTPGRAIDAAGKLIVQTARKDLEKTNGVDIKRRPGFKQI